MKKALKIHILLFVLVGVFVNCKKTAKTSSKTPGLYKETIQIDGISRRYAIYIPSHIQNLSAIPLVFELHGGGIYIEDMTGESGYKTPYKLWMELADAEGIIIVYPEGLNGAYHKPTWNDCREDCIVSSHADDVLFIEKLIEKFSSEYDIDQNRVYVSGTSNGGLMTQRLALELSNKIAAIATVAASMPAVSNCTMPHYPISVLFMNGTDDNHMPYNGGYVSNPPNPDHGSVIATEAAIDYWVNYNQTDTQAITSVFSDIDTNDGGVVQKFSYKNGVQGTEVVLYKVNGGGHSAPSIREQYSAVFEQYFNKQNHDIEATVEIWNFFKDKTLF